MEIILASGSPRRKELLQYVFSDFKVIPSSAEEIYPENWETEKIPEFLAAAKAGDIAKNYPDALVIGCDTVVLAEGRILGKPKDKSDAQRMFRLLCGNSHEVITGICVTNGVKTVTAYCKTLVTFGEYNEAVVCKYINSGAPMDKAGAYGLQDEAIASLIERVDGDADNVVGLPVGTLEKTLKEFL